MLAGNQFVGFGSLLNGKTMGDERRHVEFAACQQGDHRLEVPAFRPAHVADGVILPGFFVGRVVTAWPVRAGVDEGEFFFVVGLARQALADGACRHNARPVAGDSRRQRDRVAGGGIGAQDDAIEAAMSGKSAGGIFRLSAGAGRNPELLRQGHPLRVGIRSPNAAAGSSGNLRRQQTQQAQPNHSHVLPNLRFGQAKAMQRDSAQRGERGGSEIHVFGQGVSKARVPGCTRHGRRIPRPRRPRADRYGNPPCPGRGQR